MKIKALLLMSLFAAQFAWAGMDEGMSAYEAKNFAKAEKEFRAMADKGDAAGQFWLGKLYLEGKGVPQDNKQAASWFQKASDLGESHAQHSLGMMYEMGMGVPLDHKKAEELFAKSRAGRGK